MSSSRVNEEGRLYLGRAVASLAAFGVFVAILWGGFVPCLSAAVFHVPCPGCGSTRATKALLGLDVSSALRFNPVGPMMAFLLATLIVRTVYVVARHGDASSVGEGKGGRLLVGAIVVVSGLQVIVWALRFFGFFGGPCPV